MSIRVLLCDDHQIVRQGFKALLQNEGFQVVAEATDGHEAIRLAKSETPDLAVLDHMMPVLNGLDAGREIMASCPSTKLVLLTMHAEEHLIMGALKAGFRGYVVKTQATDDLVQALREVMKGNVYLSPSVSRTFIDGFLAGKTAQEDPLTPRERQVLQLVAEGKTSKEIAAILDLTTKTAESYRSRIMEKLDIHETAGLVRYAIRQGLIQP